jgi:antitoxin component of RelBE/YafQ-DinJ toxin-antitoxin module
MDTRIQFRVDDETKRLAQQMAESQGRTLSDACRELTEQLAEQQRKALSHNTWLTEQVNLAFDKLDSGKAVFVDNGSAKTQMAERKAKVRNRGRQ